MVRIMGKLAVSSAVHATSTASLPSAVITGTGKKDENETVFEGSLVREMTRSHATMTCRFLSNSVLKCTQSKSMEIFLTAKGVCFKRSKH